MTLIYMTATEQDVTREIATELLGDGIPKDRIHIYSPRPEEAPPMPVEVNRYRSPTASVVVGAVVGALIGALVGIPLFQLGGAGIAPLLVLIVLGGGGGAIFRLWIGSGPGGQLYRLDDALRRGEAVVVLEVDDGRVEEVEHRVKSRHPDVSVLGTDPRGVPPFP
jgi:hypothetical protein